MVNALSSRLALCFGVLTLAVGILTTPASGQVKRIYKNLVVQPFEGSGGTDFPANFAEGLRHNIVQQLNRTRRFEKLTVLTEGQQVPTDADLVLSGKITTFKAGSRGERYVVGFGAGKTKIKAMITFTDPTANKTLLEQEVHGSVAWGLFGGNSMGATNGLAKDLAKAVRKELP
ncbi:MAG: DUF4410 domain-containing protein [Acidobacteriaceae bacterium]